MLRRLLQVQSTIKDEKIDSLFKDLIVPSVYYFGGSHFSSIPESLQHLYGYLDTVPIQLFVTFNSIVECDSDFTFHLFAKNIKNQKIITHFVEYKISVINENSTPNFVVLPVIDSGNIFNGQYLCVTRFTKAGRFTIQVTTSDDSEVLRFQVSVLDYVPLLLHIQWDPQFLGSKFVDTATCVHFFLLQLLLVRRKPCCN